MAPSCLSRPRGPTTGGTTVLIARLKSAFRERHSIWRDGWTADLSKPANRRWAHLDMMVFDHGFLRLWWRNLHEIAPGVWRSNQPSPAQIADLERRGIRTIINLRGPSRWGSYFLEREECARAGIEMIDTRLYSRMPPTIEEVEALFAIFERAEKPLLMHCKSGADRAGLGAALYMLWSGRPPEDALAQLSFRYLHLKHAKTGMLDAFIEAYRDAHRERGIAFRDWLHTDYDKQAMMGAYQASRAGNFLVDRILRRE
ncbi:MAG: protein tyrosine phosphatase [Oricola sp.]|nr:MAG: protein tyrosine phosphatase [Oricola sp.]